MSFAVGDRVRVVRIISSDIEEYDAGVPYLNKEGKVLRLLSESYAYPFEVSFADAPSINFAADELEVIAA